MSISMADVQKMPSRVHRTDTLRNATTSQNLIHYRDTYDTHPAGMQRCRKRQAGS